MRALQSAKKWVLTSNVVRGAACWLMAQYIRLVWHTGRWTVMGEDNFRQVWDAGGPGIVCFWHGRLLMMPYGWRRPKPFKMLISAHRDGELIARTVAHHGIGWIAGSTAKGGRDKGGMQALRAMLKALQAGEYIGMTPDGPRGPRMRASDGIISLARLSGAQILPLTFGTRRGRQLKTWDRFLLPAPFGSGILYWGAPISVPRDLDEAAQENVRAALEQQLNDMTAEVDRLTGRAPTEPASEMWERAS